MTEYTIDTSILIGMERRYPKDVFPGVWGRVEEMIEDDRACICSEVQVEAERGTDTLPIWIKQQNGFVCPASAREFEIVTEIGATWPDWVRNDKNAADPFVVAHGAVHGRIIVTDEQPAGPNHMSHNSKIPNVARTFSVEAIDFVELARRESWRL